MKLSKDLMTTMVDELSSRTWRLRALEEELKHLRSLPSASDVIRLLRRRGAVLLYVGDAPYMSFIENIANDFGSSCGQVSEEFEYAFDINRLSLDVDDVQREQLRVCLRNGIS